MFRPVAHEWLESTLMPNDGHYHAAYRILHRKDGCVLAEFHNGEQWYWEVRGPSLKYLQHEPSDPREPAPLHWANEMVKKGMV